MPKAPFPLAAICDIACGCRATEMAVPYQSNREDGVFTDDETRSAGEIGCRVHDAWIASDETVDDPSLALDPHSPSRRSAVKPRTR